jgi:hypothetical protein
MVIRGGFKQTGDFEFLIVLSIIWKTNRRQPKQGLIRMSLKSEGLHEKHAVATWNLGTISTFA